MADECVYPGKNVLLCKKLDDVAIQILQTLKDILLEKEYIDRNLKEGYILMAKSRYLMRGRQVGILQISTRNLIASTKVTTLPKVDDGLSYLNFDFLNAKQSVEDKISDGVRQRTKEDDLVEKLDKFSIASECDADSTNSISLQAFEKSSISDPLKWFGVLVPDSLKTCQSCFQRVISSTVKTASLQNKLKALQTEYESCLLKKKEICAEY